jgi:hypothetical protein
MTPHEFIAKWQRVNLSERSACQQHFLDLCELLDQPKPAAADPDGQFYTFERGVKKTEGGDGWADVWMRGHFGWEYKRKHKDLKEAYSQLLLYREDLENPPLLVVCDMDRFEVHTNFTATAKRKYEFDLAGLAEPANLDILRKLFTEPEALRPGITSEAITVDAAKRFGELADAMRQKGIEPLRAAHFLMKLMFCMFGEDVGLLPAGLFAQLLDDGKQNPASLTRRLQTLFAAMAKGGDFGPVEIPWFNGGLFADNDVVPLTTHEINTLVNVNKYDWASVEPSIFGTLFERTLDPGKRSQIGAHYTSRNDIETLLKPVLLAPLRREWDEVKRKCEDQLWPKVVKASRTQTKKATSKASPQRKAFDRAVLDFAERLQHVTVLDPACGSGNFLYVAIHMLLDLEREVIAYAAGRGLSLVPHVSPSQLHGLEINQYAQQLAQVVIWIGYLQWMHYNGFKEPRDPVLQPIENIRCQDAILDLSDPEYPKEPEWPAAEFIVGNPPFLGNKQMRSELGDAYVSALWGLYEDRLPATSNLCCYWFEKSRHAVEQHDESRVGLLATTGIGQVGSRRVLERINDSCRIFFAISDRDWILDGASVRISIIAFGRKDIADATQLDNSPVERINADLTSRSDATQTKSLKGNAGLCFMGTTKVGAFDVESSVALELLTLPNPNGQPNSNVIRPFRNGSDLVRVCSDRWIIDYGVGTPLDEAAPFEAPFQYLVENVKAKRETNNRKTRAEHWWLLGETLPAFRGAIRGHNRYLATPRVSKHRVFVWLDSVVLPDSKVLAIALSDDFSLGVLQSRVHEVWTLRTCGWHGLGNDATYNPSLCFDTFPFPERARQPDEHAEATAAAAKELDELRNRWLNPPEWTKTEVLEFPGSVDGPWARYVVEPDKRGIGTVRWPRIVPKDPECAESLKTRTLTNLYNQRPTWLVQAHTRLDEAVFAAYGWDPQISDEELLERLLRLNLERSNAEA